MTAQLRTRSVVLFGAAAALTAVAVLLIVLGHRTPTAAPPKVETKHLEGPVAELVTAAYKDVVAAPDSAECWSTYGRILLANEIDPAAAVACFEVAEKLDPNNPRWPYFLGGLIAVDLGQPERGIERLKRATELAKAEKERPLAPKLRLAETLASIGKNDEAQRLCTTVLDQDPVHPRANYDLAMLAYAAGDWQRCRNHLETCLRSPEAGKKACVQLANVCQRLGDPASAKRYAKMSRQAPNDFDWTDPYAAENFKYAMRKRDRYQAVERYESQGRFDVAAAILRRMIQDDPADYMPHLMMGRILPQMGEMEDAERHLHVAAKVSPDKVQVDYLLSLVHYHKAERLLEQSPQSPEAARELEESVKMAEQVLWARPDYGYAHLALGMAKRRQGNTDEAVRQLREAVRCHPEFPDTHLILGELLVDQGNNVEAKACFQQAAALARPNDDRPKLALEKLARTEK